MQTCSNCSESVTEKARACPTCGHPLPGLLQSFAGYPIESVLFETENTTLYKATDTTADTPCPVVVRRFHETLSPKKLGHLQDDVARINGIDGGHLIPIIRFGVTDSGEAYRVKPFLDATSLSDLVRTGHFDDPHQIRWAMLRLAETFTALHGAGLFGTYLVTDDIGISRPRDSRSRRLHVNFNGSRFLDPETDEPGPALRQLMDHHPELGGKAPIAATSDIYTLGSIYHEILTGAPPRTDASDHEQPPLPDPFERLVRRMLDPIALRRPASPQEVHTELEKLSLSAPGRPRRTRKLATRKQRLAQVVATVSVILLIVWQLIGGGDDATPDDASHQASLPAVPVSSLEEVKSAVVFVLSRHTYTRLSPESGRREPMHLDPGTGFLIDPHTIITAGHVAAPWCWQKEALRGKVEKFKYETAIWTHGAALKADTRRSRSTYNYREAITSWGKTRSVKLIALDESLDLAILHLSAPLNLPTLTLATRKQYESLAQPLCSVLLISFPKPSELLDDNRVNPLLNSGRIGQITTFGFTADLANGPGSSGAPILSPDLRVLGLAYKTLGNKHDFTKARTALQIRRFLTQTRSQEPPPIWTP